MNQINETGMEKQCFVSDVSGISIESSLYGSKCTAEDATG